MATLFAAPGEVDGVSSAQHQLRRHSVASGPNQADIRATLAPHFTEFGRIRSSSVMGRILADLAASLPCQAKRSGKLGTNLVDLGPTSGRLPSDSGRFHAILGLIRFRTNSAPRLADLPGGGLRPTLGHSAAQLANLRLRLDHTSGQLRPQFARTRLEMRTRPELGDVATCGGRLRSDGHGVASPSVAIVPPPRPPPLPSAWP